MEKFYFEIPSKVREKDAISFIEEFHEYSSAINGSGSLHRYVEDYDAWLKKLSEDAACEATREKVPTRTFFLVRETDEKIVGMCNIRLALNERLQRDGGHIGYSIRPTERKKGYNKINLYLALKVLQTFDIGEALLFALSDNVASWKTMEAFRGVMIEENYSTEEGGMLRRYKIDVADALSTHSKTYEPQVLEIVKPEI